MFATHEDERFRHHRLVWCNDQPAAHACAGTPQRRVRHGHRGFANGNHPDASGRTAQTIEGRAHERTGINRTNTSQSYRACVVSKLEEILQ
jgi:hypothetical protein